LNRVDPSVTLATLPAFAPVVAGKMIATVKIIPFAVAREARDAALAAAAKAQPLVRVAPYRVRRLGIVSTVLPGLADKVIEKTLRITAERIAPAGARIVAGRRGPPETRAPPPAVPGGVRARAGPVIAVRAPAPPPTPDAAPPADAAAIEAVGGELGHFGMPVDPGNLLLIARAQGRPVLGAPGCARSPKENGFDWVLMRLLAGLDVSREDIIAMGVGGLLMEIVTR